MAQLSCEKPLSELGVMLPCVKRKYTYLGEGLRYC